MPTQNMFAGPPLHVETSTGRQNVSIALIAMLAGGCAAFAGSYDEAPAWIWAIVAASVATFVHAVRRRIVSSFYTLGFCIQRKGLFGTSAKSYAWKSVSHVWIFNVGAGVAQNGKILVAIDGATKVSFDALNTSNFGAVIAVIQKHVPPDRIRAANNPMIR